MIKLNELEVGNNLLLVKEIEEYSTKRGLSPQIMKIELVSISATESSFLHSVKVS